ncbi:MAG: PTS sugar transporter subunit IIA [Spirochaetaceae bacterium]|nr:MAG: PTS sugar transporter subunit IIA [Spirochaetaceae bacterium]
MELYDILYQDCCTVELQADTKSEVLTKLAALACNNPKVAEIGAEEVLKALREREANGSTGFEHGVALPHARIEGMREFSIAIAVAPHGVPFAAPDKKKSRLLFVILGPKDAVSEHLKILAAIAHMVNSVHVRNQLLKAPTATALYEAFLQRLSATADNPNTKRKMKLFFIILYVEDFLYDILEYFIQEGIDGATILESSGMGEYISNVPLFAGFIGFMQERKNHSKTILALVPEEKADQIIAGIEEITGDMDDKQGAMIIHADISFYKGSMKMM